MATWGKRHSARREAGNGAVRVGVVGLGYWGPNRLRVLTDRTDAEIAWICDRDPKRLCHALRRHPMSGSTQEVADLIRDETLEAVVIAVPASGHAELAEAFLHAGKHVFVEKPLATSSQEAEALVALASERGLTLMCGHTFMYSPPVRFVRELIESGELGELHFISSSRMNLGPYRSDVSVVSDLGPHDFSILLNWLGELPESVSAIGRDVISRGIDDVSFVHLQFPSGLLGHVELSWLAPSKLRRTVLVGSKKMAVYEDGAPEPVRIFDSGIDYRDPETFGEYQLSYRTGDIVAPRIDTTEPIAAEIADYVNCVRTGSTPEIDPHLAVDVIRVVEAAEESMANSGSVVQLGSGVMAAGRVG